MQTEKEFLREMSYYASKVCIRKEKLMYKVATIVKEKLEEAGYQEATYPLVMGIDDGLELMFAYSIRGKTKSGYIAIWTGREENPLHTDDFYQLNYSVDNQEMAMCSTYTLPIVLNRFLDYLGD